MKSVYIHVPFCSRVCVYCDFAVTTARKWFDRYTAAVIKETAQIRKTELETLYLGGGTPSFLPVPMLSSLIILFSVGTDGEVTLEANPNQVDRVNVGRWREAGINRLSIGVQSFNDRELKFLTRNHSSKEAEQAFHGARSASFGNIGIDLIFGLPGQTLEEWQATLTKALELQPDHLSVYNLTYEAGTPLFKWNKVGKLPQRDDEVERSMFLLAHEMLGKAGYRHYEISNYARPGFESRHNSTYWSGKPYCGLGPSAHSFDGYKRWWNVRNLEDYLVRLESGQSAVEAAEELNREQKVMEAILLGLRQSKGIDMKKFQADFDVSFEGTFAAGIDRFREWLIIQNDHIRLTVEGWFLYDRICREFVVELPETSPLSSR